MKKGLVFRRAPIWYKFIAFGCLATGVWVLWVNVNLTLIGLQALGIPLDFGYPLGLAMAAIEAAVSIFVTQPENWDDIWAIVQSPINSHALPKIVKVCLSSCIIGLLAGILIGVYYFDFHTTYTGLFGETDINTKSSIIVLAFCLGTEVCSFFSFQAFRMGKIAKLEVLDEETTIAPRKVYAEEMLEHRKNLAKAQARYTVDMEWQQFYKATGQNPQNGGRN